MTRLRQRIGRAARTRHRLGPRSRPPSPRAPTRRRARAGWGLALLLCALPGLGAASEFDSSKCDVDLGGDMIVRLGSETNLTIESPGLAFRFPAGLYWRALPAEPSDDPSLPPLGCPGNPIVALSIGFPFRPASPAEVAEGAPALWPYTIIISGGEGRVEIQKNNIQIKDDFARLYGACDMTEERVEFCRSCPEAEGQPGHCKIDGKWVPQSTVPAYFAALPGSYDEMDGIPFAGRCSWSDGFLSVGARAKGRPCEIRYKLMEGLTVFYSFDDARLPENRFLAFDRLVRKRVLATRAPEYDRVAP